MKNQANLKTLLENIDGVIWSVDREFRLIAANAAFQQLMIEEIGTEILPGENIFPEVLPEALINSRQKMYERAFQGEKIEMDVLVSLNPGFSTVLFRFRPIIGGDGQVIGTTAYRLDKAE